MIGAIKQFNNLREAVERLSAIKRRKTTEDCVNVRKIYTLKCEWKGYEKAHQLVGFGETPRRSNSQMLKRNYLRDHAKRQTVRT